MLPILVRSSVRNDFSPLSLSLTHSFSRVRDNIYEQEEKTRSIVYHRGSRRRRSLTPSRVDAASSRGRRRRRRRSDVEEKSSARGKCTRTRARDGGPFPGVHCIAVTLVPHTRHNGPQDQHTSHARTCMCVCVCVFTEKKEAHSHLRVLAVPVHIVH